MFGMTTFRPNSFLTDPSRSLRIWRLPSSGPGGSPDFSMDIKDNGDSYQLKADLPGVEKEDLTST